MSDVDPVGVPAAPPAGTACVIAGEPVVLLPQRALWQPARRTLLVADVHIGKAATFRALGVPVPAGTTGQTLGRLAALVEATGAQRLVVLGDLLHARQARDADAIAALESWRARHAALQIVLVRGNHDARAGDPPASLRIDTVDEPLESGPFALCHEPRPHESRYVLAGHLHPAVRLVGRADALRLPCFWLGPDRGVLPAFGDFTGSLTVRPGPLDRVFAIAGDAVVELPAKAR